MTTVNAPLVFNHLPHDPALEDLDRDIDALAEKHGCAVVFIAYKPDQKMMISASGIKDNPCPPSELFKTDPASFFMNVGYICAASTAAQKAENAAAGHA